MTTRDPDPTTAHDPTAKPLLEELPDALARLEQRLAARSTFGEALGELAELNRIIAQIRQAAPAELEVQWLRVPLADAKTILYTVDRSLDGDPTGGVLLRWPAYDALRHLLWRDDKLFAAVLGLLQDRGRSDVALRLRNGSPDTTALHGLSFEADKQFIATARMRMQAARVAEAAEVAKMDGAPVATPGPESRTPNPDGGVATVEPGGGALPRLDEQYAVITWCWAEDVPVGEWWLVQMLNGEPHRAYHPEHGEKPAHRDTFGRWSHNAMPFAHAVAPTDGAEARDEQSGRRDALRRMTMRCPFCDPGKTHSRCLTISADAWHCHRCTRTGRTESMLLNTEHCVDADADDGVRGPWSNITPAVVAEELRRVPSAGTLLTEPWISALAHHHANHPGRWAEIRNVLRQHKVLADVNAAVRHHARTIAVDAGDNVSLRASTTALHGVSERLSTFAPHELKAEIETLDKVARDIVRLFDVFGHVGDIQIDNGNASVKPHEPTPSVVGGDLTITPAIKNDPTPVSLSGPFASAALRHEPPVSPSDGLRRAMAEIDRGLEGYKLTPEIELARIQVDVLLLLVETLRGDFESRLGSAMVGALEHVAAEREREHAEKWKNVPPVFGPGQTARANPAIVDDLRAVAAAVKERLGIGG